MKLFLSSILFVSIFSFPYLIQAKVFTTLDGHKVEINLIPDKNEILTNEPMWFSFEIKNISDVHLSFYHGGDYRNKFGRHNSFSVSAKNRIGNEARKISSGSNRGGIISFIKIPIGESYRIRFLTSHWIDFTKVGTYRLNCQKQMIIKESEKNDLSLSAKYQKILISVASEISVNKPTPKKTTEFIATLGNKLFNGNYQESVEAVKALSFVNDKRAIKHFVKLLELINKEKTYQKDFRYYAFRPLAKFNDNRALNAVVQHINSKDSVIRREVAQTLSKSKHPKSKQFLLSMIDDENYSIRLDVVHFLEKVKSAKSTKLLKKMLDDKNMWIRKEAKRYLKERGYKIK